MLIELLRCVPINTHLLSSASCARLCFKQPAASHSGCTQSGTHTTPASHLGRCGVSGLPLGSRPCGPRRRPYAGKKSISCWVETEGTWRTSVQKKKG